MNYYAIYIILFVGSVITVVGLIMMFSHQDSRRARRQHIADLEHMLNQLSAEKTEIETEIAAVTNKLNTARYAEEAFKKRQHELIDTRSDLLIDRQFPDVSPRAY